MWSVKNEENPSSFCKVCFDAGKAEGEYTSHFVKSEAGSKGKVVCPTLLEMSCTYCHMKGHMKSYCAILKKNVIDRKKECSLAAYEARILDENGGKNDAKNGGKNDAKNGGNNGGKNTKSNTKSNVFGSLCCASDSDSESESESESESKEDFPALCQDKRVCEDKRVCQENKKASLHAASSYASMVSASASEKVVEAKALSWVEMNEIDSDEDE